MLGVQICGCVAVHFSHISAAASVAVQYVATDSAVDNGSIWIHGFHYCRIKQREYQKATITEWHR